MGGGTMGRQEKAAEIIARNQLIEVWDEKKYSNPPILGHQRRDADNKSSGATYGISRVKVSVLRATKQNTHTHTPTYLPTHTHTHTHTHSQTPKHTDILYNMI